MPDSSDNSRKDGRNYKISHAPLIANAARGMACAVEDGRNYKISHAPLATGVARGMACAIYKTKKYLLIVSKLPMTTTTK